MAILWGAGGTFCAGADLTAVSDPARVHELHPEGGGTGPMGPSRLVLSKPLIAAVSGYAVAGGLELSLLADLRICEEDSVFGVFCRRWEFLSSTAGPCDCRESSGRGERST